MGILTRTRDRAVSSLAVAADKGANLIAKASGLSSEQLEIVEEKRRQFLSEKPDTDSEGIKRLLGSYAIEAFEAYLPQISMLYEPIDIGEANDNTSINNRMRYFEITKWVSDPNENNFDKLINMYQVVSGEECNVALIYHRGVDRCRVYMAIVNNKPKDTPTIAKALEDALIASLKGNFPGAEIRERTTEKELFGYGMVPDLKRLEKVSIASVSNIATEKSDAFENQSMEKLLDGIIPNNEAEEYTIVLLATPIKEQLERRNALSELYTRLAPYSQWQTNFTFTETNSQGSSASFGANLGASAGIQFGRIQSSGNSSSTGNSASQGYTHTDSSSTTNTDTVGASATTKTAIADVGANYSHSNSRTRTKSDAVSHTDTITDTIGKMSQSGQNTGGGANINFGVQFSRASNVTVTIGKNEGIVQNFTNYGIKYTLDLIEKQIKRLEESAALGMWDFSAYFISKDAVIAKNAAHMYLALTQGSESYLSQSAVNLWTSSSRESDNVLKFIKRLQHPEFQMRDTVSGEWLMYPSHVNTTVSLTGKELAHSLNLPKKSVSGLPVLESVAFGREVQKSSLGELTESGDKIALGKICHMRHIEETRVGLESNSLASHTFITGSTGSGKSNTVYTILNQARKSGVKFLVVEPAKGEYKSVFAVEFIEFSLFFKAF